MWSDQAAGLRRPQISPLPHCVHCVADDAACALRIVRALACQGMLPLLVDGRGRQAGPGGVKPLFDWRRQIERGQILALPLEAGACWAAPGIRADAAGLARAVRGFAALVFDTTPSAAVAPLAGARETAWLALRPATMQAGYALLKTRAAAGGIDAILTGDAACCRRVQAACERFLDAEIAASIVCMPDEGDAIAALAVRMADEEQGR